MNNDDLSRALNLLLRAKRKYPYWCLINGELIKITEPPLWVKKLRNNGINVAEGAWIKGIENDSNRP